MSSLKKLLQDQEKKTVKVFVVTRNAVPDVPHLESLGLKVERVIGNKVIGQIASSLVSSLKRDPEVTEIEESVTVSPHKR